MEKLVKVHVLVWGWGVLDDPADNLLHNFIYGDLIAHGNFLFIDILDDVGHPSVFNYWGDWGVFLRRGEGERRGIGIKDVDIVEEYGLVSCFN